MSSTLNTAPDVIHSTTTISKPTLNSDSNAGASTNSIHTYPPISQLPSSPLSPVAPSRINRSYSSPSKTARPVVASMASNLIVKIRRGAHAMGGHRRRSSDTSSSSSSPDEEKDANKAQHAVSTPSIKNVTGRKTRSSHSTWRCSSGPPHTSRETPGQDTKRVEYKDTFICSGGVNLPLLLRATRASLLEVVESQAGIGMGFGSGKKVILDNEEWTCRITGPPLQPLSPPSTPTSASTFPISKSMSSSPYPPSPTKSRSLDSPAASVSQTSITLSPTKANKNLRKFKVHIHYYACAKIIASAPISLTIGKNEPNQPVALDRAREGSIRGLMTILSRSEPDY